MAPLPPAPLIRPATLRDFAAILSLVRACVCRMQAQGIDQWDELYPDATTLRADVERAELHLLEDQGRIAGIIVLNEQPAPEYRTVAWDFPGRALIVHRLAIDPTQQRRGRARALMQYAAAHARTHGYAAIRLDTFAGNRAALALYEKLGYRRAGQVHFRKGLFFCLEMRIGPELPPSPAAQPGPLSL